MPRSALPFWVLLSAVLATGCTPQVPRAGGPAGPVTAAASPSVSPSVAAPVPPSPPSRGPSPTTPTGSPKTSRSTDESNSRILGPYGFGALRLGMTDAQATATGLITTWNTSGHCHVAFLKTAPADHDGGLVESSEETGVNAIFGINGMRTPEGIHVGSTRAQVVRAYPGWKQGIDVDYTAVPGNPKAEYDINVKNGKVTELNLVLESENCFN